MRTNYFLMNTLVLVRNPMIANSVCRKSALGSNDVNIIFAYINREDTGIVDIFSILSEIKNSIIRDFSTKKSKEKISKLLKVISPTDKISLGKKIKNNTLWYLITQEEDIHLLINSLSDEDAIKYPEDTGYNGFWSLVLKNPNVLNLNTA